MHKCIYLLMKTTFFFYDKDPFTPCIYISFCNVTFQWDYLHQAIADMGEFQTKLLLNLMLMQHVMAPGP